MGFNSGLKGLIGEVDRCIINLGTYETRRGVAGVVTGPRGVQTQRGGSKQGGDNRLCHSMWRPHRVWDFT
jgi:hypothetical protein